MDNYRPEIDGLRAIAVLAVVFYHFQIPYFTGGFIGVDIFFVISGYLISSIIFKDLADNKFSFISFYKKRIIRILPALFSVILVSTIIALVIYDYQNLVIFGKSIIYTILFASNFYFVKQIEYFAPLSQLNTLLHTWSLSVEVQFYILFPFVIYILNKYQANRIKYYVLIGMLISLVICIIATNNQQKSAFYMLYSRAWEFLFGTLLAIKYFPFCSNSKINNLISIIGLCIIMISIFTFTSEMKYPSYLAVYPVLGTVLIIYGSEYKNCAINRLIGHHFFVFIGKISYSLYLWHWVLYVFYNYISLQSINYLDISILLLLSFSLSILSWKFVEQPFRLLLNKIKDQKIIKVACLFSSLFLFTGFIIYRFKGFPSRFSENKMLIDNQKDSLSTYLENWEKNILINPDNSPIPVVLGNKLKTPSFIIWGDSHAGMLGSGLDSLAKLNNNSFYMAQLSATRPLYNMNGIKSANSNYNKKILQFVINHKEIKTVILVGFWQGYGLVQQTKNNKNTLNKAEFLKFAKGLRGAISVLSAAQKKVVLVTNVPPLNNFPEKLLFQKRFYDKNLNDLTPSKNFYESKNIEIFELFHQLKKEGQIEEIIPLHEEFFENNKTIIEENNKLLYQDISHLSYWGSLKASHLFEKYMKNSD